MTWQQWILVSITALSTVLTVSMVGQPRTPTTPRATAIVVVIQAGVIALIVTI